MLSLICAWTNDCANNRDTGDLRRHRANYDVTVLTSTQSQYVISHPCHNFNGDLAKPLFKLRNGSLARYLKLWVVHAPGTPGTFSPPPRVSDLDMHHGTCVMHVPWCMLGSLTSGFLRSRWRGKRSRHSRCMRNPQFCVSGKRPTDEWLHPMETMWFSYLSMPCSQIIYVSKRDICNLIFIFYCCLTL